MSIAHCTQVTPHCPVEATTYGYYPNLAGNVTLLAVFGVCLIAQVVLGIKYRIIAFSTVVGVGCLGEAVGYAGRLMMHNNPWSQAGFRSQIVCLILAPSFLAAGIYLILKHMVLALGPEKSRLKPKLYTWIFICCDAVSIMVQAAGGGIASAGTLSTVKIGNDIMITGIAFQVATMFVCLLLAADFAYHLLKSTKEQGQTPAVDKTESSVESMTTSPSRAFKFYLVCTGVAFLAIFVRSVYRLPEMSGGWGNPLMQNETEFLILDGTMVALAAILMSIAHPGIFFPHMRSGTQATRDF